MNDLIDEKLTEALSVGTLKELAEILGVSTRTLSKWKNQQNMPIETDGTYNVRRIMKWKGIEVEDDSELEGKGYWETRFRKAKALLAEHQLAVEKGLFMPIAEVEQRETQLAQIFINGLTLLENRLPPLLEGREKSEMCGIIRKEAYLLRAQIVKDHG